MIVICVDPETCDFTSLKCHAISIKNVVYLPRNREVCLQVLRPYMLNEFGIDMHQNDLDLDVQLPRQLDVWVTHS